MPIDRRRAEERDAALVGPIHIHAGQQEVLGGGVDKACTGGIGARIAGPGKVGEVRVNLRFVLGNRAPGSFQVHGYRHALAVLVGQVDWVRNDRAARGNGYRVRPAELQRGIPRGINGRTLAQRHGQACVANGQGRGSQHV